MRGQMVPPGQLPPRQALPGQPVPIEGYQQMPPGQPVGQPRTAIRGPNGQLVSLYEDSCVKCLCTCLSFTNSEGTHRYSDLSTLW